MFCLKKLDSKCRAIANEFQKKGWRIGWSTKKQQQKEIYVFISIFTLWKSTKLKKRVCLLFSRRLPNVLVFLILKFCPSDWFCDFGFVHHPFDIYEFSRRFHRFDFIAEWKCKVELFNLFLTDLKPILSSLQKSVWFPVSSVSTRSNAIIMWNKNKGTQQSLVGAVRWPDHFFVSWEILFAKHAPLTGILWNRISNAGLLIQPDFQILILESNWIVIVSDKTATNKKRKKT